jgi:CDP-diacylglycerol--serine O-phosphatidyltransferase
MKKHFPNFITTLNLFSGCVSIAFAFAGYQYVWIAGVMIFVAAVFDFLDGFAARALKAYSELGKQLDSLADMVSFGIAPSVIALQLLNTSIGKMDSHIPFSDISSIITGNNAANNFATYSATDFIITFSAFLIAIFSALRLAKFNIDTRQTESFIGLPTPANAMLFASLPLILHFEPSSLFINIILNTWILLFVILLQSFLLVSEIPLFSLKIKSLAWKENKTRFIFIIMSILLLILLRFKALPVIVLLYILSSVVSNMVCKAHKTVK